MPRTKKPRTAAEAVRHHRLKSGLTQAQLGARAGISQPYISQIEKGTRDLNVGTAYKLSYALGIDPRELTRFASDASGSLVALGGWLPSYAEAA